MELTDKQKLAIRCAFADLVGSHQAFTQQDMYVHNWVAHNETISDLIEAFPELNLRDRLPEDMT